MATAGASKKKSKFEYISDIYNDHAFTEQLYWEEIADKESD